MNERGYSEGTMKLSVERETEGRPRETGDRRGSKKIDAVADGGPKRALWGGEIRGLDRDVAFNPSPFRSYFAPF